MTAFLFDLDGTLIDTAPDIADALFLSMDEFSLRRPDFATVRNWIGGGARVLVQRALACLDPAVQEAIDIDEFFSTFIAHYRQSNGSRCLPYAGVVDTLCALKERSRPMACVTNKPEGLAKEVLEHCGLDGFFTCLIGGDTLSTAKPDAAPLNSAIDALATQREYAWMVGDSATDVNAARAANIRSAWVSYGYHQGETAASLQPHKALDRFDEVLSLLGT